ncbi:MAG TPA: family 20 glycosylhydrolase [Planctomycetota bacterium]|nr:family 20 glycosylhydrolase [Planctomycetota bacterium]
MDCEYLVPYPQRLRLGGAAFPRPDAVRLSGPTAAAATLESLERDLAGLAGIRRSPRAPFAVELRLAPRAARPEGYRLELDARGATVTASDRPGLFYGAQTLLQLLVLGGPELRPVRIEDWPEFATRSFMVDLGRSTFPVPFLERIVRVLSRLKMNTLHLHLNDDQLCGLRFRKLPLGRENPAAITLDELAALVRYARRHHVTILPEFECWGHAQSTIYHFPELYGGPGMWGGMSFGIGEPLFALFARVFDELLPALETECAVHVGLDEAEWHLLPSVPEAERGRYTPTTLVARIHEELQAAARRHGRRATMHLWADHGGRPLPAGLEDRVVIQPWNYDRRQEPTIREKMRRLAGRGRTPMMMGGGMSSLAYGGSFAATRLWCRLGAGKPNVRGVTVCHWEDNDLPERMIGLYAGADYAWSPETPVDRRDDPYDEKLRGELGRQMRRWQAAFGDADDEGLRRDRGPHVAKGYYCWGRRAGRPVAPTVELARPDAAAAFE